MRACFFDSSALVKRYRAEEGTDAVRMLIEGSDRIVVCRLAEIEITAAIVRRARHSNAREVDVEHVLHAVDRDVQNSFDVVELDAYLAAAANALVRRYGLRAADGLQLAAALTAERIDQADLFTFVGSDRELNRAAQAEGLQVTDPTAA